MKRRLSFIRLLLAALIIVISCFLSVRFSKREPSDDYNIKIKAAQLMSKCMGIVKESKNELGIALSPEDCFTTGIIGEEFSPITTTHGDLRAKRSTANPDMAALAVQILTEAGVKHGDTVCAAMSGSFPALNIAVLSACSVMNIELIYIASVGASSYGANQAKMTFPDMIIHIVDQGIPIALPVAVSPGGERDCGTDMDIVLLDTVLNRIESYGIPIIIEEDYQKNISKRMSLYHQSNKISAFIGIGGSITTLGQGDPLIRYGLMVPNRPIRITKESGLTDVFLSEGIPTISLLNIQRLFADYNIPFDPEILQNIGESSIYYENEISSIYVLPGLLVSVFLLMPSRYYVYCIVKIQVVAKPNAGRCKMKR